MRVLLVEDDENLVLSLQDALSREGYRVDAARDGAAALAILGSTDIDVVLLDRDLPGVSGDGVCQALRASGHPVGILMLTAKDALADRVHGLDLGADDYLAKPFSYPELLARLRALMRRQGRVGPAPVIERAGVTLDVSRRLVQRGSLPLRLTPKEFGVLEVLMSANGGFVTADELLDEVWDDPDERTRGVVKVAVYALRKKLGPPDVIVSEAGHGYRIP